MNQKIPTELLEKFYKNQCSPQERLQILEWIKNHSDDSEVQSFLKKHWEKHTEEETFPQPDFEALYERINVDTNKNMLLERKAIFRQVRRIAAVFIGFLLLAGGAYYTWLWQQTTVYTTGNGQQLRITLPDQSQLVLNANSRIKYSKDWEANEKREVWLDGEGYFSVVHTATHQPFLVHTSRECFIEVLGTTFNVYSRKSGTKIVLNSGKIKLNLASVETRTTTQLVMQPGEMVEFKDDPVHFNKQLVNPSVYTAWKINRWILKNESLENLAARIEETYGLPVIIKNTQLKGDITGNIPTNNLDVLLEALATTLKAKITREKDQIIIQ